MLCAFAFSTPVFAQFDVSTQTEVNVELSPENPRPNTEVSVTLTSFITDLDKADIIWRVNGLVKKTGRGEKYFSFMVGNINTTTKLDVTIETTEGDVVQKNIFIKPNSVDLLWQSDGLIPPFYKGKPLFSHQNKITFIAIPHIPSTNGSEIGVKSLIYKWKLNGSVIESASGYGKNIYSIIGSLISRPLNVSVEVTSNQGDVGVANTTVSPVEPSLMFYKQDPLYGIEFQKSLSGNVKLSDSLEITLVAMPFFFGATDFSSPELLYKWAINGRTISDGVNSNVRVFRQNEGTSGSSRISLSLENSEKILQMASTAFNLTFGQ